MRASPWILHFDTGSCNGCDIEIVASLTPRYDIERFGAVNKGNPKHADVLLVTGPVTKRVRSRLLTLYSQMAEPKLVVAVGDCASTGSPFTGAYNVEGGVDKVIPVDVYVPGCAARPEAIIDGLVMALAKWRGREEEWMEVEREALRPLREPVPAGEKLAGTMIERQAAKSPEDGEDAGDGDGPEGEDGGDER